jgi:hypothetical protein
LCDNLNDAINNVESYQWDTNTLNAPSSYGTVLALNTEGNVHTSSSSGWIAQIAIDTDKELSLN